MRDGLDVTPIVHNYLKAEPVIVLKERKETRDAGGSIFAEIEHGIFRNNTFDGFVEPSEGTIWRYGEHHAPSFNPGEEKRERMPTLTAYLVEPAKLDIADPRYREFERYVESLKTMGYKRGYNIEIIKGTWADIPHERNLYYGGNGWRMHEFKCGGLGLELNPNVAVAMGLAVINVFEVGDHYDVSYMKNYYVHKMKYRKKNPIVGAIMVVIIC